MTLDIPPVISTALVHLRELYHHHHATLNRRSVFLFSIILFTLTCVTLVPYSPFARSSSSQPRGGTIHILQQIHVSASLPPPNDASYAHEVGRNRLYLASAESHHQYAATWGYHYNRDDTDWVKEKGGHFLLNKIWALHAALEEELSNGQRNGNTWIFMTDADTLILDPSIPLHAFLPPHDPLSILDAFPPPAISPAPLILANQDGNGFNSGAMFYRVHPRILSFVAHALSLENELRDHSGKNPSDQYLLGYALQHNANADVAAAFYEVPMMWVNEFWLDRDEGSQREKGDEGALWTPQLQLHLCNNRWEWNTPNWDSEVVGHAKGVYEAAWRNGGGSGAMPEWTVKGEERWREREAPIIRKGLLSTGMAHRSAVTANRWWRRVHGGIENITFTRT